MTDNQHQPEFSSADGKARKAAMLEYLQGELALTHRRRRTRKFAGGVAALVAMCSIAGLMWLKAKPAADSPYPAIALDVMEKPAVESQRVETASVQAAIDQSPIGSTELEEVDQNRVMEDRKALVVLEMIDDEELLSLLSAVGRPSVLGTINGKRTVISDSSPRRRSKSKGS